MLRASAYGLYRTPHVSAVRQQIPARRDELFGVHASTLVSWQERALHGMLDHQRPDRIAVAADHAVGAASFMRLVGIQRRVNAAEDHRRAARSHGRTNLIAAQRISRVDADPDDVAGVDGVEIERLERFIDDAWPSVCGRCGRAQDEQPARRDHTNAEG